MELSVVVPVFNEEARIKKTLSRLDAYLKRRFYSYEIIVVDDGSKDSTGQILNQSVKSISFLKVMTNPVNHGKGYATKQGIEAASGEYIFFTDADLSTPPREIGHFLDLFRQNKADILIGSRSIKGSQIKIRQSCYREKMGKVFNLLVRSLTELPFRDTQCGFKGFKKEAARVIFPKISENGFSFDVEMLIIACKLGYKIEEVPVIWVNNFRSKVNPVKDSFKMFRSLFEIRQKYNEK